MTVRRRVRRGSSIRGRQVLALAAALKLHATDHEVARVEDSLFGKRYVVEGPLMTPDGRNPLARAIWFVATGDDRPRLVTVYPIRGLER